MQAVEAVLLSSGLLVLGSVVAALSARRRSVCAYVSLAFVAAASSVLLVGAIRQLASGEPHATETTVARVEIIGANLTLAVDRLSALFLVIIGIISFLIALYSTAYMRIYQREGAVRYYPILLLFFAGVIGVVSVRDWFFFFVFWELMTILSYFLVIYEKDDPVSLRAGLKYLVVTHAATLGMAIAALALWHVSRPHSFSFASCASAMADLARSSPAALHAILALWLIGFATKAGILPFGDWLPDAYPAAPSSASAAFAGTMTNLAMYGLLRVFVDMLPASQFTTVWGIVIAVLGTGSIFVGTLASLSQESAKRLISFCVIGQMGYVFLGIGMALYFLSSNPTLALVALLGGMFHLVNGAFYKPLLFLTAGSLRYRTGTLTLGEMGGLSAVLPVTALTAGVASLAIAGVPPLNGFASKWLIYEVSIIGGIGFPIFLLFGLTAVFISLVTLASLLKYLGAAFFGQPSENVLSLSGRRAEVPLSMQFPQVVLALFCIALGLVPLLPLRVIAGALQPLTGALGGVSVASALGTSPVGLSFTPDGAAAGVWHPVVSAIALVICIALSYGLARLAGAPARSVPVWHCGAELRSQEAHFQAHGFYEPFRRAFERVYITTGIPKGGYPASLARAFDLDAWLYRPLVRAGARLAERFSRSHVGIPQWYLVWQVVGVVLVLAALFALIR